MNDKLEVVSCVKDSEYTYRVVVSNQLATHVLYYNTYNCKAYYKSCTGLMDTTYNGVSPEYTQVLCDHVTSYMRDTNCNERRV